QARPRAHALAVRGDDRPRVPERDRDRRDRRGGRVAAHLPRSGAAGGAPRANRQDTDRRSRAERRAGGCRTAAGRLLNPAVRGAAPVRMRIERLEIVPYALPFREPYVTARGHLERREMLLVRLWTDDGTIGVGEAVPLSLRGGPGLAQIAGELAGVCRILAEGEPVGWNRRAALIKDCVRAEVPAPAVAAIDMATLDLVGKQL